jgi:hypothetical protein
MSTVEYDLDGDSNKLVSSLEAAIRELTATTNAANQTTAATKKLGDAQESAANQTKKSGDAYKGLVNVLRSFGGEVSTTASHFDNLTKGAEQLAPVLGDVGVAAGVVGGAVAAAGLAAAGFVEGLLELANAAADAKDRLEKMGIVVDKESADELDAYAAGARKLSVAFDELEVAAGSKIAEDLGAIETALAAVVHQIAPTNVGLGELIGRLAGLGPLAHLVQEAFDSLFGDADAINRHLALQKEMHDEYVAEMTDMARVSKESTDKMLSDLRLQEDEDKKAVAIKAAAADAAVKAAAAQEKATEQQYLSELKWGEQFYTSLQALVKQQEHDEQHLADLRDQWTNEQLDDLKRVVEAADKQIDAELADWEKKQAKIKEMIKTIESDSATAIQGFDNLFSAVQDGLAQQAQDQLSQLDASISKQQALVDKLKNSNDAADKARLKSQIDNLNALEAEKKRLAYDAFKAQQANDVAQAIMQGAVAILSALATLGPVAGAIAAGFIGATTATQVGIIEAQSPPPAHDGAVMGADEMNIGNRRVRQGEAAVVFNQRAVQTGALEQAQRINRDQGGSGGDREVRLVLADSGRVIGELFAREVRRPGGRIAAAFGSTGVVDPYSRHRG